MPLWGCSLPPPRPPDRPPAPEMLTLPASVYCSPTSPRPAACAKMREVFLHACLVVVRSKRYVLLSFVVIAVLLLLMLLLWLIMLSQMQV